MEIIEILNKSKSKRISLEFFPMISFFDRFKGVMLKKKIDGQCYFFKNVNSIHTFFCKIPIDILFLDKKKRVVRYYQAVVPWRVIPYVPRGYYVFETYAKGFNRLDLNAGDLLDWSFLKK
jgi:hypothetical protein